RMAYCKIVISYVNYFRFTIFSAPLWLFRPLHLSSQIIQLYLKQLPTCRYTAFIPLYPIGVGPGEMWTMYQALPFVKERGLYSGFFAKFSMSYHSFLVGVLLCYPLLWLKLYLHVFKQRKSKLGKGGRKKRA
uniref:Very-long-chain (3R)-3-hydroxyacyl-CoA dehydratase n=1 Tax=Aegilops tauschii subsp. strangulata TaxID=200361 RepID=A0A452Z9R2_AEGTS